MGCPKLTITAFNNNNNNNNHNNNWFQKKEKALGHQVILLKTKGIRSIPSYFQSNDILSNPSEEYV